jgi:hypothetical protein
VQFFQALEKTEVSGQKSAVRFSGLEKYAGYFPRPWNNQSHTS